MNAQNTKDSQRMFAGLGVSRSVMFIKPNRAKYSYFVAVALIIVLALFFYFAFYRTSKALARLSERLDSDVLFYASVDIVDFEKLFGAVNFFNSNHEGADRLNEIYKQSGFFEWGAYSFQNDIFEIFKGKLEFAKLSGGEIVASVRLKDFGRWFNLVGKPQDSYAGETVEISARAEGLWASVSPGRDYWAWYIEDDRLYIMSSALVRGEIGARKRGLSVSSELKEDGAGSNIALVYINDFSRITSRENPYFNFLSNGVSYPYIAFARQQDGEIIFQTNQKTRQISEDERSNKYLSAVRSLYQSADSSISAYFDDVGFSYESWVSSLPAGIGEDMRDLRQIFQKMHGIDLDSAVKNAQDSEFAMLVSLGKGKLGQENEWIMVFSEIDIEILRKLGLSLFAMQHPVRVANTLKDGSVMMEMRGQTDGIEWSALKLDYNGQTLDFFSLRSQGELGAYLVGEIPNLGALLTNSEGFLKTSINNMGRISDEKASGCLISGSYKASIRLNRDILSSAIAFDPIDYVFISADFDGDLRACAGLEYSY